MKRERWRPPGVIVALGTVSLLTDLSSEMIYPLLPLFVTATLGGGAAALGLIEGVAEATAAVLKITSGAWTDRSTRRKPLITAGYGLSGFARPAIALAGGWPFVLLCRFMDRIGKGLRTSPRDALIADWTPPERRGMAYGLHRAMDHLGAVFGPLVAAGLLALGWSWRSVFGAALVPALLVLVVLAAFVHERDTREPHERTTRASATLVRRRWPLLLAGVLFVALGTPVDAFLLLLLGTVGGYGPAAVTLAFAAHNAIKFSATLAAGALADRTSRLGLVATGWIVRSAGLAALGLCHDRTLLLVLFLAYGIAAALTEPAERALVADVVAHAGRGRAFGTYHAVSGLGALPAGLVFGALWDARGAAVALAVATGFVLLGTACVVAGAQVSGRRAET